jgi:hypothetical protein
MAADSFWSRDRQPGPSQLIRRGGAVHRQGRASASFSYRATTNLYPACISYVRRSRTGSDAWHAMKRIWHKLGKALRSGRSHAPAGSVDRSFAVGSAPAASQSEGQATTQARSISTKDFLSGAGSKAGHNAAQLWRELREQGFVGQSRTVRDWIKNHRGSQTCPAEQSLSAT